MLYFEDLGQRVEYLWQRESYEESVFPDIAHNVLSSRAPGEHVTPTSIAQWILGRTSLPRQISLDESFGQPPVTVYAGRRFFIDVYYWVDGTTMIHQHGFAGAFHVLAGSSIHGQYAWREARRVNAALLFGELTLRTMDLLPTGTTHRIVPHGGFIHSLFHLERPSVTVVVRNHGTQGGPPPYAYLKPSLAFDPFFQDTLTTKTIQLVAMLHRAGDPAAGDIVAELLDRADLHTSYFVLRRCLEVRDRGLAGIEGLLRRTARAHGDEAVASLRAAFREDARQGALARLRSVIQQPEHRFLLGILRNAPGRDTALRLVSQRYPDERPVDVVMRLLGEVAPEKRLGIELGREELDAVRARLEGGEGPVLPEAAESLLQALLQAG
jgi:hypothetical protein